MVKSILKANNKKVTQRFTEKAQSYTEIKEISKINLFFPEK
jgi:hypothetical protein